MMTNEVVNVLNRYTTNEREPTEDFKIAAICFGTKVAECECGRICFVDKPMPEEDYPEEEYNGWRAKLKEEPYKYAAVARVDVCQFSRVDKDEGQFVQVVADCPCNKLTEVEDFIWDNRYIILKYLKRRTKTIAKCAQNEADKAASIAV